MIYLYNVLCQWLYRRRWSKFFWTFGHSSFVINRMTINYVQIDDQYTYKWYLKISWCIHVWIYSQFVVYRREISSHVSEFDASVGFQPRVAQSYNHVKENKLIKYAEIECVINGDYSVEGRREGKEVFLPFSFIQNYFEVFLERQHV